MRNTKEQAASIIKDILKGYGHWSAGNMQEAVQVPEATLSAIHAAGVSNADIIAHNLGVATQAGKQATFTPQAIENAIGGVAESPSR